MATTEPEAFAARTTIHLPDPLVRRYRSDPALASLFPIWAGQFIHARGHQVSRPRGIDSHLLLCCLEGGGVVECGGTRHRVGPGHVVWLPARKAHRYRADPQAPWSIVWTHFIGRDAGRFHGWSGLTQERPLRALAQDPRSLLSVRRSLESLLSSYGNGFERYNAIRAASWLRLVLVSLIDAQRDGSPYHADQGAGPKAPGASSATRLPLGSILEAMESQIAATISLPELASRAGYSLTHFSRLFHQATGFAPLDYFLRLKMKRAADRLSGTGMTMREIARELGYDDEFYFSRLFKRIHGESPRAWRISKKS